ncbi:retrovirus-related pol polyprotein from transposon TNT 1-94 [Tanacetum coccineum]
MACDVSWKSRMTNLSDENVLLKTQVEYVVQERENIKLEFQKQFNSIKATRVQHQQEVNELIEHVNQKTHAYADVRAKNQDLLITISELKVKLAKQAKNMNTKFDKSAALNKLVCVTPLNKNKDLKATTISKVQIKTYKSKLVTSHSTSDNEQSQKKNANDVKKSQRSFTSVANKNDTMKSNVSDSKTNVLKAKTVNVVHDGSNLVCVSCGKDVFMISHDKCVARYALSTNYRVIQIVLWIVDNGCSKHMTCNLKLLRYFIEKFMGTVRFGLGHNLFSVGQFCDGDLEVAFPSNTCFVRNLEGGDLLTGSRESNLYTISISEMDASSPVCLMSKATSTKSWLWHQQFSHLNFGTINQLSKNKLVDGLLRFKKMKPKADIGPGVNCLNFQDSSEEMNDILLQEELDNLFGPLYEEYYVPRTLEVLDNSTVNTLENEDTPSSSSIIFKDNDASQIVTSLKEPSVQESLTLVLDTQSDKQIQEDVAKLDGNTIMHSFETPEFKEVESSSNYQDPSNMHEFHQQHRYTDKWTKMHPIE